MPKGGYLYYRSSLMCILFLFPLFFVPLFGTSDFILDVALMGFHYAYLGLAWNILSGFVGQISFGHAVFYGIGAYTTMLFYVSAGVSPWFGLLLGGLLSATVAFALGFALFKLRGSYFALSTWAVAEIFRFTFLAAGPPFGAMGLWPKVVRPDSWWDFQFHSSRVPYYEIMLVMLLVCLILCWKIRYSRLGLRMLAVRDNEETAQSLGINPFTHKQIANVISAALTAIGGSFYAQYILYIDPEIVMSSMRSIDALLPAILGGIGTVHGPVVGGFCLTLITWVPRLLIGRSVLHLLIRGLLIVIIVVFVPKGVTSVVVEKLRYKLVRRWRHANS